ncbi:hypothetical protein [Anaerovibrio lipolyticus]|uniref:hypothetical protein n=1 Tax=Anaerovibrio lipolyticus TaxID=82374 RepID=UPI00047F20E4|nr:hypothetical protein [Anaerovibrio lipolyticus]
MKEDRFTELALEALICRDEQKKEAILQEALAIEEARLNKLMKQEKPEKPLVHYDVSKFTLMVDGDYEPPYEINKKSDEAESQEKSNT